MRRGRFALAAMRGDLNKDLEQFAAGPAETAHPAVDDTWNQLGIDRTAASPTRRSDQARRSADGVTAHPTGGWLSSPRHGPPMTTPPGDDEKAVAVRRRDQLGGLLHEYQYVA